MATTGFGYALDALYASLPTVRCRQLCASACGPIKVGAGEWRRMVTAFGAFPSAHSLLTNLRCPFLVGGKDCSIYADRPTVCRLWGAVRGVMECPHGCQPDRWLTPDEAWELLAKAGVTRPAAGRAGKAACGDAG